MFSRRFRRQFFSIIRLVIFLCFLENSLPCGRSVIKLVWTKSPRSSTPLFRVVQDGKVGFVDRFGKLVIPPQFDDDMNETGDFVEGLARVRINGKWGYVNPGGQVVISPQFDYSFDFSDGLALVRLSYEKDSPAKIGYIDKAGTVVLSLPYSSASDFSEGAAAVVTADRKLGYIDKTGNVMIEPQFALAEPFHDGRARVAVDGICWVPGSFNRRVASPTVMPQADDCGNPPAWVEEPCLQGFIDRSGNFVVPPRFTSTRDFSEGLAAVEMDGQWGFVNQEGAFAIEPRFEQAWSFSEGLAVVKTNHKLGYIDHGARFVILPTYDSALPFTNGIAKVGEKGKWSYIDRTGAAIPALKRASSAGSFVQGLADMLLRDGGKGWINKDGKIVYRYRSPRNFDFKPSLP